MLDGTVSDDSEDDPLFEDAARIIDYLNAVGPGPTPRDGSVEANYDLNHDGFISPSDVLRAVNLANAAQSAGDDEEEDDSTGKGPPDTMGAVGPGQIVEMLNTGYTVYSKTTRQPLVPTVSLTQFWNDALARSGANEVQRLVFSGTINNGFFSLGYGPLQSAPIVWNDQPDALQQSIQGALDALFGAGNANASAPTGGQVDISFGGGLAGVDLSAIQVADHLVGGSVTQSSVTHGTGNEVQQLVFSPDVRGGSFVLQFPGVAAQTVQWSSDAAVLLGNLRAGLTTMFGAGRVGAVLTVDGQVRLVFAGQFAGQDVAPMTVVSGLTSKQPITVSTIANVDGSEVQRLKFTGSPSGGVIVVFFDAQPSPEISWNDNPIVMAANIQAALTVPSMFGPGNVLVSVSGTKQFDIAFGGQLANVNLEEVTVSNRLYGDYGDILVSTVVPGSGDEVQRAYLQSLYLNGLVGTTAVLHLTLPNGTTVSTQPIVIDANTETTRQRIEAALNAADALGPGNAKVLNIGFGDVRIVFCGALAGVNLALMTLDTGALNAQIGSDVDGDGNEVQRLAVGGTPTGGSFTIKYGLALSAKVSYSNTAAGLQVNLQSAVNSMFGAGNATVSSSGANHYDITFGGQRARINLSEMTVQSSLTGSGADIAISTIADGAGKEMQRLTFPSGVNGGSLIIAASGGAPQTIAWNADGGTLLSGVQQALDAIFGTSGINPTLHNAIALVNSATQIDIAFGNQLDGVSVAPLTVVDDELTVAGLINGISINGPLQKTGRATDPRVIYDPASGHWFAAGLGHAIFVQPNQVLLAVSKTSDPRDGWSGFVFRPDDSGVDWIDFPQLGVNADGIFIVANMVDFTSSGHSGTALISVPKSNLIAAQASIDNATVVVLQDAPHTPDAQKVLPGFGSQPVVDFGPSSGAEAIISNYIAPTPVRYDVSNAAGPGPATMPTNAHTVLDSALGTRFNLAFVLSSPPQPTFYIRGNPDQPVAWSTDWVTLRNNLQAALDKMFGPGNSGIVGPDMDFSDELSYSIYLSTELPSDAPQLTNILAGNANFERESGRVFDEQQRLSFGGTITGGSFTLRAPDSPPQTIQWSADRAVLIRRVRTALEALEGVGNVVVLNAAGGAIDIKFGHRLDAQDVPDLIADGSGLTGNAATATVMTILDGANVSSGGSPHQPDPMAAMDPTGFDLRSTIYKQGGSYWLAYTGATDFKTATAGPIAYSADPNALRANIEAALDAALGSPAALVSIASATEFDVEFQGAFESIVGTIYPDNPAMGFDFVDTGERLIFPAGGLTNGSFSLSFALFGKEVVRWMEIDAATNIVKQAGNISDPNLSFFYPSLAVNSAGDVVIGFSGSGSNQYPSAYYAIGHTVGGHTIFDEPRLLQQGNGSFSGRWGDYSATVLDPTDPTLFWTFQEYTVAKDHWGVKIAAIRSVSPNENQFLMMHNSREANDVDGDAHVAPGDALTIINYMNAFGSKPVPPDSLGAPYCDVNGDGFIAPNDVVEVINRINAAGGGGEGEAGGSQRFVAAGTGVDDLMMLLAADVAGQGKRKS